MNELNTERVRKHLQNEEVQERIKKRMLDARSKATVTISRAAGLFDFSESQLREWEKRGLLKTERPAISQDGRTLTGHRQFSPDELDKLAIIRELVDEDYSISEIPNDIDRIWQQIVEEQRGQASTISSYDTRNLLEVEHVPIDKRVERINEEVFWRYLVSQVLRLSLLLLCEEMSDTKAGLIISLQRKEALKEVYQPGDQPEVGPSLIGWLGKNCSFNSFLDDAPSFTFPSDFRIQPLPIAGKDKQQDNILIVIQREARPLSPSIHLIETIRCLVDLLYQHVAQWRPCFGYGMRDWEYQITDFTNLNASDIVLNRLADMVIELGGKVPNGQDRWHFASLFLPKESDLPVQQRNLVVRAQSKCSPYQVGVTTVHTKDPGLSFRAYQSGHVIYRPKIALQDIILASHELEGTTSSAMAIPIAGDNGLSIAVLYVASDEVEAFSIADQRVLRVITRMIEELLETYRARQEVTGKLGDLITNPGIVDPSFKEFLAENEFINDLEVMLTEIQSQDLTEQQYEEVLSFIAIDIDNQGSLATKYGDQVARNLSRAVGLRIRGQLGLFSSLKSSRLYHVHADSYYLMLRGITLEEARSKAALLLQALSGDYRIDARRVTMGRPMTPESMLDLHKVTVRLGVPSYKYGKLKEVILRYPAETAVTVAREVIMNNLDQSLQIGQQEGGNIIISWDPVSWGFRPWSPPNLAERQG
jgi:DNA-binding transcriptional MerR regulator/GGDEF domain-containing protein